MNSKQFIEVFNSIKAEEKGRKGVARGLSDKDERELKKIIKRGFTVEEISGAIRQMFRDADQWAVSTGNDIPTHFLRPANFERYVNDFMNIEAAEQAKKEEEEKKEVEKVSEEKNEEIEADFLVVSAKEKYLKSLEEGKWLGDIFEAKAIGREFSKDIRQMSKNLIFAKAKQIYFEEQKRKEHLNLEERIKLLGRSEEGIFCLLIIERAIKRKIFKNW